MGPEDSIEKGVRGGVPGGTRALRPAWTLEDPLTQDEAAKYEALLGGPALSTTPSQGRQAPAAIVAEDDPAMRGVLSHIMEGWDFRVIECNDGASALKGLVDPGVSLLLVDLRLPALDGFEVIRGARCYLRRFHLIIVAMSAIPDVRHEIAALDAGADAFLKKPFSHDQVLAHLKPIARRLLNPLQQPDR